MQLLVLVGVQSGRRRQFLAPFSGDGRADGPRDGRLADHLWDAFGEISVYREVGADGFGRVWTLFSGILGRGERY